MASLSTAHNGFVLLRAALVLMMTPALGLFYAGFVRGRNVLNTLMMSFGSMALVSVTWVLWGYSLAFSEGVGPLAPFIGGLSWAGLWNWSAPIAEGGPSHGAVALFQLTFAIITPALVSGAVVERISFRAWMLFVLLWSHLIYLPMAHMLWAPGGFLGVNGGLGALDFAGGFVVEMASGVAAAVAALVVGPRRGHPEQVAPPHNVPFIVLGAGLLWFGWFGFNGGSGLVAGNLASLVAITPAAGFVSPLGALAIGALAALACSQAPTACWPATRCSSGFSSRPPVSACCGWGWAPTRCCS